MAPDRHGERCLVTALALLVTASLALFVYQLVRELRPEWIELQQKIAASGRQNPRLGKVVQVADPCTKELDRCLTCHPGKDVAAESSTGAEKDLFVTPHPAAIAKHFSAHRGCSSCHGGQGRALRADIAHLQPGETDRVVNRVYRLAACARCHVPGAVGTGRLAEGAELYLELGCQMCHPLSARGLGGWDYGPNLARPGLRRLAKLRQGIIEPAADFAGSTMPAFAEYFQGRADRLENLLAFLLTLSQQPALCPGPRRRADVLAAEDCTVCHRGAGKPSGPPHRCPYIGNRAGELACRLCHQQELGGKAIPAACPAAQHRPHCIACHRGGGE